MLDGANQINILCNPNWFGGHSLIWCVFVFRIINTSSQIGFGSNQENAMNESYFVTFIFIYNNGRLSSDRMSAIMRYACDTTDADHLDDDEAFDRAALTRRPFIHWTRKWNAPNDLWRAIHFTHIHYKSSRQCAQFASLVRSTNFSFRTIAETKIIQQITNDNKYTRARNIDFRRKKKHEHIASRSIRVNLTATNNFRLEYLWCVFEFCLSIFSSQRTIFGKRMKFFYSFFNHLFPYAK